MGEDARQAWFTQTYSEFELGAKTEATVREIFNSHLTKR